MGRLRDALDGFRGRRVQAAVAAVPEPRRVRASRIGPELPHVEMMLDGIIRASYDIAKTNDDNRRHWANADGLAADAGLTSGVRTLIRNRSRLEFANHPVIKGIGQTLAEDVIGSGPMLRMRTGNKTRDRQIVRAWERWAGRVRLARKLLTMRLTKCRDGEVFAMLISRPGAGPREVALDVRLLEADQVATLNIRGEWLGTDGITLDGAGNPISYQVLTRHPGDTVNPMALGEFTVPARFMIHWFNAERPGQHRGVPELASSLPFCSVERAYMQAVLDAARLAADVSGVLHSDQAPTSENGADDPGTLPPGSTIETARNMVVSMPGGWDFTQVKAEQPINTFADFRHEVVSAYARPVNMPFSIAAADTSRHNMASGRLDTQLYLRSIKVQQAEGAATVLEPIFDAWAFEAALVGEIEPLDLDEDDHDWLWDEAQYDDPVKAANAADVQLKNESTTLQRQYSRRKLDWEPEVEQWGEELRAKVKVIQGAGVADPVSAVSLALGMRAVPAAAPEEQEEVPNNAVSE